MSTDPPSWDDHVRDVESRLKPRLNYAYRLLLLMAGSAVVAAGFAFHLEPPHRMQPNQINGLVWLMAAMVAGGSLVPNFAIASFTERWKAPELVLVGGIVCGVIFAAVLGVWG